MDYEILVNKLSERTGINNELFDLNSYPSKNGENGILLLESQNSNHHYYSKYECFENTNENWKSISLYISKEILPDFLYILNSILEEENEEIIDLQNIKEFQYNTDENGFNILLGTDVGSHFRVDFARKNNV